MKKRKKKAVPVRKANIELKRGMVFFKDNHVYTRQMIVSDKIMPTTSGVYRECVAWNDDMCRRFDTSEDELCSSKYICTVPEDELDKYVNKNKKSLWNEPEIPVINI